MLLKGGCESGGRRKEPLLEQLVDERGAECIADLFGILLAARAVVVQCLVNGALLCGVRGWQRLQLALCIERIAFGIDQVAFEAADHDLTQLLFIGQDVSSETLVVQQLQQRGEGFGIAVVWGGRQEQPMLEVRADGTDEACALTLQRVVRTGSGGNVVCFIDDQHVEFAWIAGVRRQNIAHGAQSFAALDPVHGCDQARMRSPGIGMDAAIAAQLLNVGRVDNPEIKAKLFQHLDTPLFLQRCGADDQDGPSTVPQQHLLDDETGLDGLAQADVIGDEQIDAGHVNGTHQWVELEVLNADATAKRRLQKTSVRVGGGTPANRIKKRVEGVGVILASN